MNLDNLVKIWLNNLHYMEQHSDDVIVDFCLSTFDLGYKSGELEYLDKILELIDPKHHSLNALIGILTWSNWHKDKLPHRDVFKDRLVQYLHDSNQFDEGLILGLV